jgi:hypothetical protein
MPVVVPPAVEEAVAECVPLCSTVSLNRLISPTDQSAAAEPVCVTRT